MIPNRILVRLFNIAHDWHTAPYLRAREGRRKLPVAAWRASRPIRRRAGQRPLVLGSDVRRPVVAVTAALAEVEGGDCALRQESDESEEGRGCRLQDDATDRENIVEEVEREWRAQDIERRPRPGLADHRETNVPRPNHRARGVSQCRRHEGEREVHGDGEGCEAHLERERELSARVREVSDVYTQATRQSEKERDEDDPEQDTELEESAHERLNETEEMRQGHWLAFQVPLEEDALGTEPTNIE